MYVIKEVKTRRDSRRFTEFPNKLYVDNPYYVPALSIDEEAVFNPKKNPAHKYCHVVRYLALNETGKVVGRIGGIINTELNKVKKEKTARLTRIDMIDDIKVTELLINTIIDWAKSYEMTTLIGPMGFTDLDRMGMLVEGFDVLNMAITIYNAPYYHEHLEKLGFKKDADWIEMKIDWPQTIPEKIVRVSRMVESRYGYRLVKLKNKKEIPEYAKKAFETYNKAYMNLYGFHPLNDEMMEYYTKQVMLIVQLDYIWFVLDEKDQLIAFGIVMPSLALALKKSKGKLFPFGLFRILKALKKHDIIDFYFVAVDPKHQSKGALALLMEDGYYQGEKRNIKYALTGPELVENVKIQQQWQDYNPETIRRRRSYRLEF